MKKSEFVEQTSQIWTDSWSFLGDKIESIELKSGEIISPNLAHMRIKINQKGLHLLYGNSESFGAILQNLSFSYNLSDLTCSKIVQSPYAVNEFIPELGNRLQIIKNNEVICENI